MDGVAKDGKIMVAVRGRIPLAEYEDSGVSCEFLRQFEDTRCTIRI